MPDEPFADVISIRVRGQQAVVTFYVKRGGHMRPMALGALRTARGWRVPIPADDH